MGRIGFEGRYDYGAIGNVVILASRLSSQARENQILLSQRSHSMVEGLVEVGVGRRADPQGLQPARAGEQRGRRPLTRSAGRLLDAAAVGP